MAKLLLISLLILVMRLPPAIALMPPRDEAIVSARVDAGTTAQTRESGNRVQHLAQAPASQNGATTSEVKVPVTPDAPSQSSSGSSPFHSRSAPGSLPPGPPGPLSPPPHPEKLN
jgi:hypothetical protein